MLKEICIILFIIISIVLLNAVAQNYTNKTFEVISIELEELGNEFKTEEEKEYVDGKVMEEKLYIIKEKWEQRYKILAYYIEHDELEKVYTSIASLDGLLRLEEIKEKYTFTLMNIF